jgi:hypothetical protein
MEPAAGIIKSEANNKVLPKAGSYNVADYKVL